MTYSREQYDTDLAKYQEILEEARVFTADETTKVAYALLAVATARLENFNSYSVPQ